MSLPLKALAFVVLLSFLINGVSSPFWVVYATDQIRLSTVEWGLILLIAGIVQLLAFFPAGLLVDQWGRKNTLLVALLISLIATPLFIVVHSFAGVLLVRIAFAVSFSFALPASTALMADMVPRNLRGQIMAAIGQGGIMIGTAGGGVGGPALGYLFIPPAMLASLAGGYAVLFIVGSGLLFWGHTREMGAAWSAPDFSPQVKPIPIGVGQTRDLSIPLGRFQKERPPAEPVKREEPAEDVEKELAKHGEIIGAMVMFPPYEEGGYIPAINFRWKIKPPGEENDVRTIQLGEALLERPSGANQGTPVKYKFVGCERDPENPGFTYFLFDMKCDGTDIQKVHWKLEEPKGEEKPVEPATGPVGVSTDKMYVGPRGSATGPGKAEEPEVKPVEPVAQPLPQPPVTVEQEPPSGSFFEEEGGVLMPTAETVDYLERNYEKILEETRTEAHRGRDFSGIRVVGISNASVANQFGIMKDDVNLKINVRPVGSQAEAVNAVKEELKKTFRWAGKT